MPTSQPLPDQFEMDSQRYLIGDTLMFTPTLYIVSQHGRSIPREIQLSQKESQLLHYLCQRPGQVIARTEIIAELWNDSESSDIGLNKNILMIRRKLESLGIAQSIRTVPRVGYTLVLSVTVQQEAPSLPPFPPSDEALQWTDTPLRPECADVVPRPWVQYWPYALLCLGVLLVAMLPGLSHDTTIDHLRKIKTAHGIIYRNDRSTDPLLRGSLAALDEGAARNQRGDFRMMISDRLISVVLYANGQELWEKAFFIGDTPLALQLRCVIAAMARPLSPPLPPTPPTGTKFNVIQFYAPCEQGGQLVATYQNHHTGFGEQVHSVVQAISLWNPAGELVAEFERLLYRQAKFQVEGDHPVFEAESLLQAIKIEQLHRERLDADPYLALILSSYTGISPYHSRTLEADRNLHVADLFGGMLTTFMTAP